MSSADRPPELNSLVVGVDQHHNENMQTVATTLCPLAPTGRQCWSAVPEGSCPPARGCAVTSAARWSPAAASADCRAATAPVAIESAARSQLPSIPRDRHAPSSCCVVQCADGTTDMVRTPGHWSAMQDAGTPGNVVHLQLGQLPNLVRQHLKKVA